MPSNTGAEERKTLEETSPPRAKILPDCSIESNLRRIVLPGSPLSRTASFLMRDIIELKSTNTGQASEQAPQLTQEKIFETGIELKEEELFFDVFLIELINSEGETDDSATNAGHDKSQREQSMQESESEKSFEIKLF